MHQDDFESSLKDEWLTTEQAAEYLGLTVGALRNMTSNGQLPYYKLGNRNRYSVIELRQLLMSQKRGACHGN
jgi:excisionase family DNA binding protein